MKLAQTMKVSQLMTRDVKSCSADDSLSRAAQLMWDHDCGFVPVVDIGRDGRRQVIGVITDRDVCMATYTKGAAPATIRVGDVMSRGVRTCHPDDTPLSAMATMRQHRIRRLAVVDTAGDLVGVLSLDDLVRSAVRERGAGVAPLEGVATTLAAVCEPWCSIRADVSPPVSDRLRPVERASSAADIALARRQEGDEQC